LAPDDPALVDHSADAARGKRAAREAEDVDLVARLVVRHQKDVGVVDVLLEPRARGAAEELVLDVAGADSLIVVDDLLGAVRRALAEAVGDLDDVRRTRLAGDFLIGAIPRPVAAEHDSLHIHRSDARLIFPTSIETLGGPRRTTKTGLLKNVGQLVIKHEISPRPK